MSLSRSTVCLNLAVFTVSSKSFILITFSQYELLTLNLVKEDGVILLKIRYLTSLPNLKLRFLPSPIFLLTFFWWSLFEFSFCCYWNKFTHFGVCIMWIIVSRTPWSKLYLGQFCGLFAREGKIIWIVWKNLLYNIIVFVLLLLSGILS